MGTLRAVPKELHPDEKWRLSDDAFVAANAPGGGNMQPLINETIDALPSEETFQRIVGDFSR